MGMLLTPVLISAKHKTQSNLDEHVRTVTVDLIPALEGSLAIELGPLAPWTTRGTHPDIMRLVSYEN